MELKEKEKEQQFESKRDESSIGIDRLAAEVYSAVTGEDENSRNGNGNLDRNSNGDVELRSGFYGELDVDEMDS